MHIYKTDEQLKKVIELSSVMIKLADLGDVHREDIGCGIVFGVLRDEAYKIRKLAEKELREHQKNAGANTPGNNVDTSPTSKKEKGIEKQ